MSDNEQRRLACRAKPKCHHAIARLVQSDPNDLESLAMSVLVPTYNTECDRELTIAMSFRVCPFVSVALKPILNDIHLAG